MAALALAGVARPALEAFVTLADSYEERREFWASLSGSSLRMVAYGWVYRDPLTEKQVQMRADARQADVDECSLWAGALYRFLTAVHAMRQDDWKQEDLARALIELRDCVQQRKAAAESEAASGADWCAQGTGIVAALEKQHKSLAHELDELTETGEIHWKRLGQMGGVALGVGAVALYFAGWGAPADGEPSLVAQACAYADSAQSFFSLHFVQPLQNIVSELRPDQQEEDDMVVQTGKLVEASAVALDALLSSWRADYLKKITSSKGAAAATAAAAMPAADLAAQAYTQQCLTPAKSLLSGSLMELMMIQKEQMQLDVLVSTTCPSIFQRVR